MNLTFIPDTDPLDPASVHEFLDLNALAHAAIHTRLLEGGLITPQSPLTYEAMDQEFLRINGTECRAWAAALGLGLPPDISTVDHEDREAMLAWFNHYDNFMRRVAAGLGL